MRGWYSRHTHHCDCNGFTASYKQSAFHEFDSTRCLQLDLLAFLINSDFTEVK